MFYNTKEQNEIKGESETTKLKKVSYRILQQM